MADRGAGEGVPVTDRWPHITALSERTTSTVEPDDGITCSSCGAWFEEGSEAGRHEC